MRGSLFVIIVNLQGLLVKQVLAFWKGFFAYEQHYLSGAMCLFGVSAGIHGGFSSDQGGLPGTGERTAAAADS